MTAPFHGKVDFGNNLIPIPKEDCTVYEMKNETGQGYMTRYTVFPGVEVLFNDFHMEHCVSEFKAKVSMLSIDYCSEGHIEWEYQRDKVVYVQAGDLQISRKNTHATGFVFPTGHYHGVTVAVCIEEASRFMKNLLDEFSIDVPMLYEKFTQDDYPFILRGEDSIKHIFSEMDTIPGCFRIRYLKVKALELLLFLSMEPVPEKRESFPYFTKKQVNRIKEIQKYMIENIDVHFTLDELSQKFHIPLTPLKLCFSGVYGLSIYAYMRAYRMHKAAALLHKPEESIGAIANQLGYENVSKFSAAFRNVMGISPSQYRKNLV